MVWTSTPIGSKNQSSFTEVSPVGLFVLLQATCCQQQPHAGRVTPLRCQRQRRKVGVKVLRYGDFDSPIDELVNGCGSKIGTQNGLPW